MGIWFWLNVPAGAVFFGAYAGVPLRLVFKHPDEPPRRSQPSAASLPRTAALCVGLGASAPRALAGDTAAFAVAFVLLRGLQLALYARVRRHLPATRRLSGWYLVFFGAGGTLWVASLAVPAHVRYALWGAGLLAETLGAVGMLAPGRRVPLNTAHLAERFRLFVPIVLGESVARLVSAAAPRPWSVPLAVVLAAALMTPAALWQAWLSAASPGALDSSRASGVHRGESPDRRRHRGPERRHAHRDPGRRRGDPGWGRALARLRTGPVPLLLLLIRCHL